MTVKIKDTKEHIKDLEEDIKEEVIRIRTKLKMEDRTIIKLIWRVMQRAARCRMTRMKKHLKKKDNRRRKRNKQQQKRDAIHEEVSIPEDLKEFKDLEMFKIKNKEEEKSNKLEPPELEEVLAIGVDLSVE